MVQDRSIEDLELTDAELMTVLKNHGMSRRFLMKVFGAGAAVTAISGTAAAGRGGRGIRIDDVYGAPYSRDDTVPSGLVDHVVALDHLPDGVHEGFPAPEGGDEFVFDPVGLHVKPGDIVHFDNHHHEHTASAFHNKWNPIFPKRVPDGVPGFTSPPFIGGESWLYRFTTKGVYDLFCFPHFPLGMAMRIVVFDPEEDDIGDDQFAGWGPFPDLPPFANAETVLTTSELAPANIVDEGQIAWADLAL